MSDVQVVGISGSPRKKATDYAVRWALDHIRDSYGLQTEYFSVRGKTINYCIHCDYCIKKQQGCIHDDDLQPLYPLLEQARIWIVGSPVYHGHISAQTKAVLDRTRASVAKDRRIFENKVGLGLAVGGDRNGGQEQVLHTILDFYLINEMIPVSGGVFGANLGGTVWSRDKGAPGAEKDVEGLKSLRKTIARAVKVSEALKTGQGSYER